jgi:phosphoadenosine phosphosulfate reductase
MPQITSLRLARVIRQRTCPIEVSNMTPRQEIRTISVELDTPTMLRYLIEERFSGKTVITASLMASSIVVLKMISEIDPATPVIFCQRPPVFEESTDYRNRLVESLGLQNISLSNGHEAEIKPGDSDHIERMKISYRDMPGRSVQLLHLNECLAPYSCWISAVYHLPREPSIRNRVDVDGHLIKVDPLIRWTKDDVREFMRANDLPYHEMAKRQFSYDKPKSGGTPPTYHF